MDKSIVSFFCRGLPLISLLAFSTALFAEPKSPHVIAGFKPHNLAETEAELSALAQQHELLRNQDIKALQIRFDKWNTSQIWVKGAEKEDQNCLAFSRQSSRWAASDSGHSSPRSISINLTGIPLRKGVEELFFVSTFGGDFLSYVDEHKAVFGAQTVILKSHCTEWVERLHCSNGRAMNCKTNRLGHTAKHLNDNSIIGFGRGMAGSNYECELPCPPPEDCPDIQPINDRLLQHAFYVVQENAPTAYATESACKASLPGAKQSR